MTIDSHQHFWNYDPVKDAWIEPGTMDKISMDFLPIDLKPILDKHQVDKTIAVQASQQEQETRFLLDLAKASQIIAGIVGWVDLRDPDLEKRLNKYKEETKLVGFRHILQSESDGFMLEKKFIEGIKQLKKYAYCFDILVYARQLPEVIRLLELCPDQPFVLDHIGKPDIKSSQIHSWEKNIRKAATHPNLYCKVSGMITEAHWKHWQPRDIIPYLDVIFDSFGPSRCMFGSDWPVCLLAGSYEQVLDIVKNYIQDFSNDEKEMIFGGTCKKFYKIVAD